MCFGVPLPTSQFNNSFRQTRTAPPPPPTISVRFRRVRLQRFNKIGALKTAFDLFDRLAHTRRLFMGRIKHTRFQVSLLLAPYRREGENTGNKVENEEKRGKPYYQMNHV